MRWLAPFLVLLLAVACNAAPPAGPGDADPAMRPNLVLVANDWAPYTAGADRPHVLLDLVEASLADIGYAVTFEITAGASDLESERYDGSPALWRSAEREAYLLYSDAYYLNRLLLVGRKGTDVSAESLAELEGKRVGLVRGYAYGPEVLEVSGPELVQAETMADSLGQLMAGEVDYVVIDALVLSHLVQAQPEEAAAKLEIGAHSVARRSLHLAIKRTHPDAEKIIAAFNAQIPELVSKGSYHRALGVPWILADVDGDGEEELMLQGDAAGEAPPSGYVMRPLGESRRSGLDHVGFFVDGKRYESWDDVPETYKKPIPPREYFEGAGTANIVEFRF